MVFLNYREGGEIYFGINKSSEAVGIDEPDDIQLKIKDRLKHNIEPSCMGLFDLSVEDVKGKKIVKLILASGNEKPYYIKKKGMSSKGCYLRVGSSSEPMSTTLIEDFFSKRTRNSLSKIKSNKQDLSFEQIKIYYNEGGRQLNNKFASNLEFLTIDGAFNYVAYLMSDINNMSIKVAKYSGVNRLDLIESNEYGYCSLIKATKQVLDKLTLENKTFTKIMPKERQESWLWHPIALREAVINAMVHNDYAREVPPKFEIFDDRLGAVYN